MNPQDGRDKQKQTLLTAQRLLVEGGKDMGKTNDLGGGKGSAGISLGEGLSPSHTG